ncbi:hypothetical protein [Promicromonospora sp. NFX87]|uniref:hypothetical protein n=1 Tax=Promicromonospora sp. NFX87 TaxID=3402691 RepID=UPI003AFB66A4
MSTPDVAPERPRPVLDRATGVRITIAIAVMMFVIPAVILRDGVDPLSVVLAAGTVVLLALTAIQVWMLSTAAHHLSRWTLRLVWTQLTVMVLLLAAMLGGPIVEAVFSPSP